MYNRTGIVRAPCGHHELPVRYPQSVFSNINKRPVCVTGHEQDDLGEDAVNAWSTCEAGEPEAAAVAAIFSSIAFFVRPSVLQLSWRSPSLSSDRTTLAVYEYTMYLECYNRNDSFKGGAPFVQFDPRNNSVSRQCLIKALKGQHSDKHNL